MLEVSKILADAAAIAAAVAELEIRVKKTGTANEALALTLKAREQKVADIESAETVLAQAKQLRDEAAQLHTDLATAQATLDNNTREAMAQIAKERDSLNPLYELQKQVAADKKTLADGWAALEAEKVSYQERIRAGLLEHFKAGGR